jgi:iron complex transport system substrate-binding protein
MRSLILLLVLSCAPLRAEIVVRDEGGRTLRLAQPARRIVSLAPHITENLFAIGAGERVVGAVQFSDYPEAAKRIPRVGGYDLDRPGSGGGAQARPRPGLEERQPRRPPVARLSAIGIPCSVNEARRIDDVPSRASPSLGKLAGTDSAGEAAAQAFRKRHAALRAKYSARPPVRIFYQAWNRPLMTINGEHLISDVIRLCGGDNVFAKLPMLAATGDGRSRCWPPCPKSSSPAAWAKAGRSGWTTGANGRKLPAVAQGNLFFIPP